ncbi:DUF6273 domain-containing protein [Tissierella sp. MB52-C2]|uniref:DUF6273 domain-containing protein n=1 Tax=Tissierella sp. MB52-C2 TaxID=3070999 RepID=UPI00280A8A9C|nr:DUF6273 domain-containing protein [Tissierella sp. MB52-C2]WMM26648.1 DUF6273 domain-containing protein [Tissierella sp. MB52-C2]
MAKLLSSLPVGAKVKDINSKYYGSPIIWQIADKNHAGYPANSVTLISEKILCLKASDGKEPSNPLSSRANWGNNDYKVSNILQWLNSGATAGNWYSGQHSHDAPPIKANVTYNSYDTEAGFLNGFATNFVAALLNTTVKVAKTKLLEGGSEEVVSKIFLASTTEVGLTNEAGTIEGSKLSLFTDDESRKAYPTVDAVSRSEYKETTLLDSSKPFSWDLRTPYTPTIDMVYMVSISGSRGTGLAHRGSAGIRPLCNLPSGILISDTPDSDGAYRIIFNTAPTTPPSITVPTTVRGGNSLDISWGASTDSDSNLSGYILERSVNGAAYTQVYKGTNRRFTDSITKGWNTVAYRVKAYDSQGAESGYTTSATRTVVNNTAPSISGQDSNLGDKNLGFLITYQVDDVDTSDTLVVTEKLNGSIIRTVSGAPRNQDLEIEITNETLFKLELNSNNTIEIKIDDQQGGIAYRRFTFRRTNSAPIIDGQDKDLGQKTEPFSIDFSVSDNEGNAITVKTYINNVLKEEYQAIDGATNTFTISSEDWYRLRIGQHNIRIEARDEHGATAVRNYIFTRYDDKIQFTLKAPIETDIMATKILVTPTWTIPAGAVAKVEACNNAFDEVPTWEDITSQVNISRHYNFTNDIKIADKSGINIKVSIEKGTATEEVVINGFGGAFE